VYSFADFRRFNFHMLICAADKRTRQRSSHNVNALMLISSSSLLVSSVGARAVNAVFAC